MSIDYSTSSDKNNRNKKIILVYIVTGILIGAEYFYFRFNYAQRMTDIEDLGTVLGELVFASFLGVVVSLIWPIFWLLSIIFPEFLYSLDKFITTAPDADTSLLELIINIINLTPFITVILALILLFLHKLSNLKVDNQEIKKPEVIIFPDTASEQAKRLIERNYEDKLLLKLYNEEITAILLKLQSESSKLSFYWLDNLKNLRDEIIRFNERFEGIKKIEDLKETYPVKYNTIEYKLNEYNDLKDIILEKITIYVNNLERLSSIDKIVPKLTFNWLIKHKIDINFFLNEFKNLNEEIIKILNLNEIEKNSLYNSNDTNDKEKLIMKIIDSEYYITQNDFSEINLQEFDQISKNLVKIIGVFKNDYNIKNILIKGQLNIVFAKQVKSIQKLLERDLINLDINFKINETSIDKELCEYFKVSWKEKWNEINIFNVAYHFNIGLINSSKYIYHLMKVKMKIKKEMITVSDQIKIEEYVQKALKGIKDGTLEEFSNPAELISKLDLTSLKTAFMIISDITERLTKKKIKKEIKSKEKPKIQETKKVDTEKLSDFQKKLLKMGRKNTE